MRIYTFTNQVIAKMEGTLRNRVLKEMDDTFRNRVKEDIEDKVRNGDGDIMKGTFRYSVRENV